MEHHHFSWINQLFLWQFSMSQSGLLQASGWKSHPLGPRLFESFVAQRHEALASATDADGAGNAGNWRWDMMIY